MALLEVVSLSKRFAETIVLQGANLVLNSGERVGLVGTNGVGKSTLVRIIAGEMDADEGTVRLAPGLRLGYLAQTPASLPGQSVAQFLASASGDVDELERKMRAKEADMARADPSEGQSLARLLQDYAELTSLFEVRGGYQGFAVDEAMEGLRLGRLDRSREIVTLSGGEKARLALVALLLQDPDLLLLDEPTNHLDFAALEWLETALTGRRGGMLVVSHDRVFLDRTVTRIVEVDEETHSCASHTGDYSAWATAKAAERCRRLEAYDAQQEEIRALRAFVRRGGRVVAHNRKPSDGDKFVYNFKGGRIDAAKSRDMRAAEERLRRLEAEQIPRPLPPVLIDSTISPTSLGSRSPISTSDLGARYGENILFSDLSLTLENRSRVVIVGPNGAGKSTLLRLLAGVQERMAGSTASGSVEAPGTSLEVIGSVRRSPGVLIGWLDQEQESLSNDGSVYEGYAAGQVGDWETLKAALIMSGLFTWPELARPVSVLSTGQKRKLQFARLIAARPNVLLLDEPTNHLTLDLLEQIEDALHAFEGPIVAVTHDRRFLERFGGEVWELAGGHLRRWAGGWEQYHADARRREGA